MTNNDVFVKEANEFIQDLETERQELWEQRERLSEQLQNIDDRIQIAHDLVGSYLRKHPTIAVEQSEGVSFELTNKSYPDMLAEIAKKNNCVLNVSEAIGILKKAKVGGDDKQIAHNVYNTLARSPHFTNITKGQYRYTSVPNDNKAKKVKPRPGRSNSGLREVVRQLKEAHPLWTREDVFNYLKQTKFDFKTKWEKNALALTWGKLGYSKELTPIGRRALSLMEPLDE